MFLQRFGDFVEARSVIKGEYGKDGDDFILKEMDSRGMKMFLMKHDTQYDHSR